MNILPRIELYALVWAEPMRTLAAKFEVSDVWLKKRCAAATIPVPNRGYWAKLAAGKKVTQPALPPREPGQSQWVQIGRDRYGSALVPDDPDQAAPPEPTFEDRLEDVRSRVARKVGHVPVLRDFSRAHPAVRKLLDADQLRIEKLRTQRFAWEQPLFEGGYEKRRLKILNSLGMALPKCGGRLESVDKYGRAIGVVIGDTRVSLRLDHPKARPNAHGEWRTREGPSGPLSLAIQPKEHGRGEYPVFDDAPGLNLEQQLGSILLEIVVAGEAEYRRRELQRHSWEIERLQRLADERRKRLEEAARLNRERKLAEEKARRQHLLSQAQAWRTANDIRGFVAAVLGTEGLSADQQRQWADWALSEANSLDPLTSGSLRIWPGSEPIVAGDNDF